MNIPQKTTQFKLVVKRKVDDLDYFVFYGEPYHASEARNFGFVKEVQTNRYVCDVDARYNSDEVIAYLESFVPQEPDEENAL